MIPSQLRLLLTGVTGRLLPASSGGSSSSSSRCCQRSVTSQGGGSADLWELGEEDAKSVDVGGGRRRPFADRGSAASAATGGFRVLVIPGLTPEPPRVSHRRSRHPLSPRVLGMRPSQTWRCVWPVQRSFHPACVPLPVRQGRPNNATENAGISPNKWGNTELMKLPNFLHLTPAHVAAHCAAIKHLCTPWPQALADPAVAERHLPMRIVTTDYLRATASLRDPRARRVDISLPLAALKKLADDERSREKLLCLVGLSNYASVSEENGPGPVRLRMWSDRCPWRFQNYDYLMYALSALYRESLRQAPWEAAKEWRDNCQYKFSGSSSEMKLRQMPVKPPAPVVDAYAASLRRLHRTAEEAGGGGGGGGGGETHDSLRQYGRAVERLLRISSAPPADGGGSRGHGAAVRKDHYEQSHNQQHQ